MPLDVQITQRDAKVSIDIGSARFPARGPLLQAEHRARELKPEIPERTQRHGRYCREDAPPEKTFCKTTFIVSFLTLVALLV